MQSESDFTFGFNKY